MIKWADLEAFMAARDPKYREEVRGVPDGDIAACEEGCAVILPQIYVGFLGVMGADCGALRPFGPTQDCGFHGLVEDLPARYYPGDRYFKVSREGDMSRITRLDTFLDLDRSDGADAPLVQFEDGGEFAPEAVTEFRFTLGEQLARNFFRAFELNRRPHRKVVRGGSQPAAQGERDLHAAVEVLGRSEFEPVLPLLPRVACLGHRGASALVELHALSGAVSVHLGAEDMRALGVVVEQILAAFPDAVSA